MADEIETSNDQMVGIQGGERVIVLLPKAVMTVDEALRQAAWLVAMAEVAQPIGSDGSVIAQFQSILDAVRST